MKQKKEKFVISFTIRNQTARELNNKKINITNAVIDILEKCNVASENDRLRTVKKGTYLPIRLKDKMKGLINVSKTIDDNLSLMLDDIDDYNKESCNGWKNWETWNTNLWLTNDYDTYQDVCDLVAIHKNDLYGFQKALAEFWDDIVDKGVVTDQISKHRIDWREISESMIREMKND